MTLPPCIEDCGLLADLGPPPDLILRLPPPPVPAFLQNAANILVPTNGSCDLCSWAKGNDVPPYVEVKRKGQSVDDAMYFIVISACIGVIIMSVLVIIAILRCKEAKVKPTEKNEMRKKHTTSVLQHRDFSVANSSADGVVTSRCAQPKVLWSGLGTTETSSPYTLQHQPVDFRAAIDYGAAGHTYAYANEVVRIMNDGENNYCYPQYPDSLDSVSFENCGYVNSENHATSL